MTRSTDEVRVTTWVNVDPATAFELFTAEVDAWWRRGPRYRAGDGTSSVMRFEPGPGGRLVERVDPATGHEHEIGRVKVWEPGARLVLDWRARSFEPGQTTEVEVRFEADGDGTRVTLEHRGWDAMPPDHPVRHGRVGGAFLDMMGLWWGDAMTSFRQRASRDGR
jgi:hypothetical protein